MFYERRIQVRLWWTSIRALPSACIVFTLKPSKSFSLVPYLNPTYFVTCEWECFVVMFVKPGELVNCTDHLYNNMALGFNLTVVGWRRCIVKVLHVHVNVFVLQTNVFGSLCAVCIICTVQFLLRHVLAVTNIKGPIFILDTFSYNMEEEMWHLRTFCQIAFHYK